jgi:hypothetical protein
VDTTTARKGIRTQVLEDDDVPSRRARFLVIIGAIFALLVLLSIPAYFIVQDSKNRHPENVRVDNEFRAAVQNAGWELDAAPSTVGEGVNGKVRFGSCKLRVYAVRSSPSQIRIVLSDRHQTSFWLTEVNAAALRAKAQDYGLAHCHPPTLN